VRQDWAKRGRSLRTICICRGEAGKKKSEQRGEKSTPRKIKPTFYQGPPSREKKNKNRTPELGKRSQEFRQKNATSTSVGGKGEKLKRKKKKASKTMPERGGKKGYDSRSALTSKKQKKGQD